MELTLIAKLKDIQSKEGLTDREMANQLGCSRQLYQATRTGKLPPSNKIVKGIMAAFPELRKDVIYFLTTDAKKLPSNAIKSPLRQLIEPQGRGLKRFCVGLLRRIKERLQRGAKWYQGTS